MPRVSHVEHDYWAERARPHPDEVIAELAAAQAGRVARWQLVERDLTRREIGHRLASGHLHSVHRGVYAVGHVAVGAWSVIWAGVLALGPEACAFGRSAAKVWELRPDNRLLSTSRYRHVRATGEASGCTK